MEMASQAVQVERTDITPKSSDDIPTVMDASKTMLMEADESEIAALAYKLWQERGCPVGSPDEDWFRAGEELKRR